MKSLLALALSCALAATTLAQGNQFKVRYTGGTLQSKVKPDDWKNQLTVTSEEILLALKDGQKLSIKPQSVTRLTYGQNARRMVGTMIALSIINPLALFGLFHKKRSHYVGIEFKEGDKAGAVLLQADKGEYRALLTALRGATGKEVETITDEKKK